MWPCDRRDPTPSSAGWSRPSTRRCGSSWPGSGRWPTAGCSARTWTGPAARWWSRPGPGASWPGSPSARPWPAWPGCTTCWWPRAARGGGWAAAWSSCSANARPSWARPAASCAAPTPTAIAASTSASASWPWRGFPATTTATTSSSTCASRWSGSRGPTVRLRAGRAHRALLDAGQAPARAPRGGPADRVVVVAHQPLDAGRHHQVVGGQGRADPWDELQGDLAAADDDVGLVAGGGGGVGHPADEQRRRGEVVELVGLPDAVAVALPPRKFPHGARERLVVCGCHGASLAWPPGTGAVPVHYDDCIALR